MPSWPWTGMRGRGARYPVGGAAARYLDVSGLLPMVLISTKNCQIDSLPPVCLPHLRNNSDQLNAVPFGAFPAVASAQFPLSKA
jgi:hypothetical protein